MQALITFATLHPAITATCYVLAVIFIAVVMFVIGWFGYLAGQEDEVEEDY